MLNRYTAKKGPAPSFLIQPYSEVELMKQPWLVSILRQFRPKARLKIDSYAIGID
jgi:hypothetical protein